jgi:GDPmannose 4,6-dehydratase
MFVSNGILFNHESPRRGENFVTRKITLGACAIKLGLQSELLLGNLDAKRDWGYAKDYVEAMWLMLQADEPDDYIIATGNTYSVRDFCKIVFDMLDMDFENYVKVDERYFRPTEVDILLGDSSKAEKKLGWKPKTNISELARLMIDSDMELLQNGKI